VTRPFNQPSLRSKRLLAAVLVFLVALLIYRLTLAPTVTLVDSGELTAAARFLGVAHPPGFPLYLILAHLISLLPLGSIAVRINFASAIFAALACGMLTLVAAELIAGSSFASKLRSEQRKRESKPKIIGKDTFLTDVWLVLGSAISAGFLLAFSRTLWSYATIAEVYTLNSLLILTILFLMLRWRRCIRNDANVATFKSRSRRGITPITDYDPWLYPAAIVLVWLSEFITLP
jgi:hypothetical protein